MSAAIPATPRRGAPRPSHLRQVSNGSSETFHTDSSTGTAIQHASRPMKQTVIEKCTLWVHEKDFPNEDVVLDLDLFPTIKDGDLLAIVALKTDSGVRDFQDVEIGGPAGTSSDRNNSNIGLPGKGIAADIKYDVDPAKRYLFVAKDMKKDIKAKHSGLQVSIAKNLADVFMLKHRSSVLLTTISGDGYSASHVELTFKDEYLARSDMWRLVVGDLSNRTVYKGQKVLFMGTIKAQITAVYLGGHKVHSAFFSTDTKPIFRSESARYVIYIQMSREMWDFDSEGSGEIMFNKVVNGFLPALFKKWAALQARHLVSIILFTRVEYDTGLTVELGQSSLDSNYHTGVQTNGSKKPYKDFYRVVVSEMASGAWTVILHQLKREFKFFRRDISLHRLDTLSTSTSNEKGAKPGRGTRIEAQASLAMYGNVLEAINMASSQFSHDYIDRDLMRTGISVVLITPCSGLFEVDYETLRLTTENLIGNGMGIDLICLPKMPLHSVPLFRYRNPQFAVFHEAAHLKSLRSEDSTPRQNAPIIGSYSSMNESLSPNKMSLLERSLRYGSTSHEPPSEWSYAIPHWLDVSFWTGATQDVLARPVAKVVAARHLKKSRQQHSCQFEIRCKMYELEMGSAGESFAAEISVTPLQHDPLFLKMITGHREIPHNKQDSNDKTRQLQRKKLYSSLTEYVNGPSKQVLDKNTSQAQVDLYKALDTFDLTRAELLNFPHDSRHKSDPKKFFKSSLEDGSRRSQAADLKILGTSSEESGPSRGMKLADAAISARPKPDPRTREDVIKPRADNASNVMKPVLKTSPSRPPKFGRQISLGKYGFGIAAPKVATAALQTEHVRAERPDISASLSSETIAKASSTMASHLLGTTSQDRPSSSHSRDSDKSKAKSETLSLERKSTSDSINAEKSPQVRPITIKSPLSSVDATTPLKTRFILGSLYEGLDKHGDGDGHNALQQGMKFDDSHKLFTAKLLAGDEPPATLSPTTALSPWLTVLNPSNPTANDAVGPSQYKRWQHVFPRPVSTKTMKWKSLCSPASVPLTTEYFPTKCQLDTEYQQKPYNISQNHEDDMNENPQTREEFLRELIGLRLSQGFQIVVGPAVAEAFGQKSMKIANVFDPGPIAADGISIFMSMGNIIHQLSCVNGTEVEVNMYIRKPTSIPSSLDSTPALVYKPAVRTTLAEKYISRDITLGRPSSEYNWNYVDSYIAGFDEEMSENLRFWRARFVLIPVSRPTQADRRQGEDNEEEIRLEGIRKLTQMWQRHRYMTPSERRFENKTLAGRRIKDPNPLDIVYKTEDPSVVITAELETLPLVEGGETYSKRGQLMHSERFQKSDLDFVALAHAIQQPVEKGGVRFNNRLWHLRLHWNCFIGSEMTTWLLENFTDIESREEAEEFGKMLMAEDDEKAMRESRELPPKSSREKDKYPKMFSHVDKRHGFRDGQFFYQITDEFSKVRPESRSGWFSSSRRRDYSVPSTPMTENLSDKPPRPERQNSGSATDGASSDSGANTPTPIGWTKRPRPKVALSKVMKYDVDHRRRSYRTERINLHYDRLHNPDNCYHIRIDWMSVTAKLIEDAIESWATTAERYGLRLVEAPIGEACTITSVHPFRSPYHVVLSAEPPEYQPVTTYFGPPSYAPPPQTTRHFYQKAIMKKFNFVLDIEAAQNFPANVDVTYSWGRPDFKYSQYIHRSGVVLAQITDDGNFLLLANRLFNNRNVSAREDRFVRNDQTDRGNSRIGTYNHGMTSDRPTPFSSPALRPTNMNSPVIRAANDVLGPSIVGSKLAELVTPESVKNEIEAFCSKPALLEQFYREVMERSTAPPTPSLRSPYSSSMLSDNIPTLGLPPGILARDTSPSPMRLSSVPGVASTAMQRRSSWQINMSNGTCEVAPKNGSPRGSIVEEDNS
ncbi:putative vacuolar membrane protein IML1 [Coleophoma crateriformis]|uniref:Vacuolar membrane-associated protein IML1 n=1 Tax=Coleophoma crateriformis TaxID=565419 RepID=A0A3D8S3G0_9HELO|nr:putative vacuolar membrane protein IML1 [Coleophoma crateriformis]